MVHQGQRLPLGLEAGDDLAGVHARLDDLQGDRPLHRLALLGHVDGAHAAFADLLQQLVRADGGAEALTRRLVDGRGQRRARQFQEAITLLVPHEQPVNPLAEGQVAGANPIQKGRALDRIFLVQGLGEDGLFLHTRGSRPVGALGSTLPCDVWRRSAHEIRKIARQAR